MALTSNFNSGRPDEPTSEEERTAILIAALLRERDMEVRRGRSHRVVQVDAELARLGYDMETTTAEPVMERAVVTPVRRPRRS